MSPPGKRSSTWRLLAVADERNPVVRLSRPQTTLTGAHEGERVSLVRVDVRGDEERELPASSIIPAMKWRIVSDISYGAVGIRVVDQRPFAVLVPDAHMEVAGGAGPRWSGLAMNVMPQPLR